MQKKKMVQWPIVPKINEGDQYIGVGQWAEISKALSCLVLQIYPERTTDRKLT